MFLQPHIDIFRKLKLLQYDNENPQDLKGKQIDFIGKSHEYTYGGSKYQTIYISATITYVFLETVENVIVGKTDREIGDENIILGLSFENYYERVASGLIIDTSGGSMFLYIGKKRYNVKDFRIYSKGEKK